MPAAAERTNHLSINIFGVSGMGDNKIAMFVTLAAKTFFLPL